MTNLSNAQGMERNLSATAVAVSVFLILASFAFLAIAQMAIVPAMNGITKWLDLSPGQIEFLQMGTSVCFAFGILAGGFIPVNKRRPLIIGITMIILSILVTAIGFCDYFHSLIAVRFAVGACCGLLTTTLVILGFDHVSQRFWHTWIALKAFALMAGGAIAFIFSGLICSKTGGHWQLVFFILGPLGVVLSLFTFFIKDPVRIVDSPLSLKAAGFSDYLSSNPFMTFIGSAVLATCCLSLLNSGWWKIYCFLSTANSAKQATPIIAAMGIILVSTVILSALVSELVSRRNATGTYMIVAICWAGCILSSVLLLVFSKMAVVNLFIFFNEFSVIPFTVLVVSLARSSHRALIFGLSTGVMLLLEQVLWLLTAPIITNKLFLSGITILLNLSVIGVYSAWRTHRKLLKEKTHWDVKCPECGSVVEHIPVQWLGKRVRCETCKCEFIFEIQHTEIQGTGLPFPQ